MVYESTLPSTHCTDIKVICSPAFFFINTGLAILVRSYLHIHFKISLLRNKHSEIALNLCIYIGGVDFLTILTYTIHEHGKSLHLLR